jgi:hypothetical protein
MKSIIIYSYNIVWLNKMIRWVELEEKQELHTKFWLEMLKERGNLR